MAIAVVTLDGILAGFAIGAIFGMVVFKWAKDDG